MRVCVGKGGGGAPCTALEGHFYKQAVDATGVDPRWVGCWLSYSSTGGGVIQCSPLGWCIQCSPLGWCKGYVKVSAVVVVVVTAVVTVVVRRCIR